MRSIRSIRRPSASMIVSCVALFAALGGSSYAAVKITGKEIANHTIRGVDVKKRSLGPATLKLDSLGGDQINESALGTVPNADTLDGLDSTAFMKTTQRVFEVTSDTVNNFASDATLAQLPAVPAGSYLVTAKLTYDNDGAGGESETCTLEVPGANDETQLYPENTDVVMLQKAVTAGTAFDATLSCTGDGTDDALARSASSPSAWTDHRRRCASSIPR
jgi:hypothetical protein